MVAGSGVRTWQLRNLIKGVSLILVPIVGVSIVISYLALHAPSHWIIPRIIPTTIPPEVAEEVAVIIGDISVDDCWDIGFIYPYSDDWELRGDLHGRSYGQMALDYEALDYEVGGEPVASPLNGEVVALYTDTDNNPTVVIENACYSAMLLHGAWDVVLGQTVIKGDIIGKEGNQGYVLDGVGGIPCANLIDPPPTCGFHTHLNVRITDTGENIDPRTRWNKSNNE